MVNRCGKLLIRNVFVRPDWYIRVVHMPLPMERPGSGTCYVREAVPISLRPLIGRAIEKLSLRTKDPEVARIRCADAVREIEARWAMLLKRLTEGARLVLAGV